MKKTVGRGVLYYLFLLLAVVSGVACVIGAIMVLSPGTEIFGMCYYVHHDSETIKNVSEGSIQDLLSQDKIKELVVNTNYTDLKIITQKNSYSARFLLSTKISGIIKKENQVKDIMEYGYDSNTKTLTFTTKFPEMFLPFSIQSELILIVPENSPNLPFDIHFTTETGGVKLGTARDDNYVIKNLYIVSHNKSEMNFGEHTRVSGKIDIDMPKGNIDIYSQLNAQELYIHSTSAKISGGDIKVNAIHLRTEGSSVKLGKIDGNLTYDARKGVLIVKGVTGNFTCSEEVVIANITLGEVDGTVILPAAESSNISITNLHGIAEIRTTTGNVTIKNAESRTFVTTKSGTIDVVVNTKYTAGSNEQTGVVNLNTESGKINVKFANILSKNYIQTNSGTVNCNFAQLNYKIHYNCPGNVPQFSSGITLDNVGNEGTVQVGVSSYNMLDVKNQTGHTNFDDTYVLEEA